MNRPPEEEHRPIESAGVSEERAPGAALPPARRRRYRQRDHLWAGLWEAAYWLRANAEEADRARLLVHEQIARRAEEP